MSHQTFTSFADFQKDDASNKILLATVEYAQVATGFSATAIGGSVFKASVNHYTDDSIIVSLKQSLTTYTQETSLGGLNANNEFFYDPDAGALSIFQDATATVTDNVHVLRRRLHVGTEPLVNHDEPGSTTTEKVYFEPRLSNISPFTQDRGDPFQTVNIHSKGRLSLINADGFYDDLFSEAFFEDNQVKIYSTSRNLSIGGEVFLGGGKTFDVKSDRFAINLGFEDLFEEINKIRVPITGSTDRFRNVNLMTNISGRGGYEPDAENRNPRYLYGRIYKAVPLNTSYGGDDPSMGANTPAFNRNWNFADHVLKNVRTSITALIDTTNFVVATTGGMTVGAAISVAIRVPLSLTDWSTISAIGVSKTITVNTAFPDSLATGQTVIQHSVQNVFMGAKLVTSGSYDVDDNFDALNGNTESTQLTFRQAGGALGFSPEGLHSLPSFQPNGNFIIAETVFGKPSISTLGNPDSYTTTADLLEFPGEIMMDLLVNVLSINSNQINTSSFLSADSIRPVQVGLVIPQQRSNVTEKLVDVMQRIQASALGQFRIGRTNKLEYFVFDTVTANQDILTTVTTPLTDKDFLEYRESQKSDHINQKLLLLYRFDEIGNNYQQKSQVNTEAALLFPNSHKTKEIKTIIYSSSTAESISSLYSAIYSRPHKIIDCKVKMQTADLLIGDRQVIEKVSKVENLIVGDNQWASVGAAVFSVAPPDQTKLHGYWTDTNGALTNGSGIDIFNASLWDDSTQSKTIGFTATQETFEVIAITKNGFTTNMKLTNFGGNIITSTA